MESFTSYFQAGLGIALIGLFALAVRGVWTYATKQGGPFDRLAAKLEEYLDASRKNTDVMVETTSRLIASHEIHAVACDRSHQEVGYIKDAIREACDVVERLSPEMFRVSPQAAEEVQEGLRRIRRALDGTTRES